MLFTLKMPVVIVPVLSKTIEVTFVNFCKWSKFLNKKPFSFDIDAVLNKTIGTANPKAHGQAITKTDIATLIASKISWL